MCCWLILVLLFIYAISSRHLHRTDRSRYISTDYHTCFYYNVRGNEKGSSKLHLSTHVPYCIREIIEDDERCHGQLYTFDDMYKRNWTISKLIELRAVYDVVDSYQYYIDTGQLVNDQSYFCHCTTKQSFGHWCEYTFNKKEYDSDSFEKNLNLYYSSKRKMPIESMYEITNGSCYVDIYCITNSLCLQWNEICDGKRDCLDGQDEEHCSVFESVQCDESYRCLNGFHCIPKEFSFDFHSDCTDGSDEQIYNICNYYHHTYECDNTHCGWEFFSCGDGQCIVFQFNSRDPDEDEICQNRRDWRYVRNLLGQSSSIRESCWKSVLCLFDLKQYFPLETERCILTFDQCSPFIRFPFFSYFYLDYKVYFLYKKRDIDEEEFFQH